MLAAIAETNPSVTMGCVYQVLGYIQGVLNLEKDINQRRGFEIMILGALICLHSIFKGLGRTLKSVDASTRETLLVVLEYVAETDADRMSRDNANATIDMYYEMCFV